MPQGNGDAPRELFLIDGNSLAYRAFFALPESISTSDGRPTNAIFGFASMLVKILTDYGQVPTVVVWDAGMSGRKEISPDYKAQRSTRPDLLKLQWPHLRPLVEAFGYRNISVEGFEADDVIAALAEQAKQRGIPVMVVTGDRDAYQLVDDGVRIMSTSRGVTDTKVYDREGVIERYGIPPELVPDFIGLKGDTSDNIPGVPGIGDKTAADLLQKFGDLEGVLASIDQITGAKRKQNLTEHADNARMCKMLATMVRDIPIDLDLEAEFTRTPDRANLRQVFRDWELRDPLRRLEEALEAAELEAIPRPEDVNIINVKTALARHPGDIARMKGDELVITLAAPEVPEGELIPREPTWRYAAYAGGNIALAGETDDPSLVIQSRRRPPRDRPRRQAARRRPGQPRLRHRDRRAICSTPPAAATRSTSWPRSAGSAPTPATSSPRFAVLIHELAKHQRPLIEERGLSDLMNKVELPLVHVLRECEKQGIKLDTKQLETVATRIKAQVIELEREIWELAEEEFVIGSPQQLGFILFDKLKLSRKRRGKTGYSTDARVLQAIRDEHEIIPQDRALPRALQARPDLPGRAAELDRRRRPAAHDVRADDGGHRAPVEHQPEPAEHPDPHRDGPRDPRLLHPGARERAALRRLRPGRAARPRAHRQRAGAAGHLRPRRGRPHRDGVGGLRAPGREARRRHALQGQDGQLRDRLRPVAPTASPTACGSSRTRRRSSSTATWSASRPSRSS